MQLIVRECVFGVAIPGVLKGFLDGIGLARLRWAMMQWRLRGHKGQRRRDEREK